MGPAEPTCRPAANWEQYATPESLKKMQDLQQVTRNGYRERLQALGLSETEIIQRLEGAGVAGIFTSSWTGSWGAYRLMAARNATAPSIAFSCEDYGLLYRLAQNNQGPVAKVDAEARELGTAPTFNIIGEIRGTEKPDEYIILSAHFDSWDGGAGATDNTTGTVTMMEAMRILKKVYPNNAVLARRPLQCLSSYDAYSSRSARRPKRKQESRREYPGCIPRGGPRRSTTCSGDDSHAPPSSETHSGDLDLAPLRRVPGPGLLQPGRLHALRTRCQPGHTTP